MTEVYSAQNLMNFASIVEGCAIGCLAKNVHKKGLGFSYVSSWC